MNLICPHCQQHVTIADSNAGQQMKCPICNNTIAVPALPPEPVLLHIEPDLPEDIPLVPLPPAPTPDPKPAPVEHEEGVYRMSAEPVKPVSAPPPPRPKVQAPPPPRLEEAVKAVSPQAQPTAPAPPPPPPPPAGYERNYSFRLDREVIPWIGPVALAIVFFLLFFTWTGAYPGGYGVYTQSGFQAFYGGFSTDPTGEGVLHAEKALSENIHSNWFRIFLLVFFVLAAAVLAAAPLALPRMNVRLPAQMQQIWPWRSALAAGAALLAFLILLSLWAGGLSLENAVETAVTKPSQEGAEAAGGNTKEAAIQRGRLLGAFDLERTVWFRLAMLLNLVALAAIGLEMWLERRGNRPEPRVDVHW